MGKRAEQHGGQPPSGTRPTGYGWLRPGYLDMPSASNDNRIATRSLLRRPQFWTWLGLIGLALTWIITRL
ncbi:hypothetical protein [Ferrovibrio terrae]|uniref:hypothetical protein n=1 Tax=Ferrovibrio terrae TaxID=2594003 RepID=UPI003137CC05